MNPFHYAKSFFSNDYLPQQLTWAFGLFLLSLVAVMAGLVLIRRAFGRPIHSLSMPADPPWTAPKNVPGAAPRGYAGKGYFPVLSAVSNFLTLRVRVLKVILFQRISSHLTAAR
jgi:hypothetical protein